MSSTKEQIAEAARKRFKTEDVDLGGGITVALREISRPEKKALNGRLFVTGDDGEPTVTNDEYQYREKVFVTEEWLAATMTPAHTVDELVGQDWPDSLKAELRRKAMALNGITVKDEAKNS